MPKFRTAAAFVLTATKCEATAFSPRAPTIQFRATRALANVSAVVKVLEATTNKVDAGSRSDKQSSRSAGSTLDTKRQRIPST